MSKTRIQSLQRPIAKGKHQRPQTRWEVRENPPNGQPWGQKTWPGAGAGSPPVVGIYGYSSAITAPPASGTIRFNNAAPASVTTIWLNETAAAGADPIPGFIVNDPLRMYVTYDPTLYFEYKITAAVDSGAYRTYTVTYTASSGAFPADTTTVSIMERTAIPYMPYNPGDDTVAGVQAHVNALPMDENRIPEIQRILDAELADKNRSTLVAWLQSQLT